MRVSHVLAMYPLLATPCYPATPHLAWYRQHTYPLTQEPLSYYLLQGFSLLLACGKVFNIWRELPVASCALRVASCESRCQRTARHIHFNFYFHFPSTAAQREFLYFFVEVFLSLSALYKFVSGSSDNDDDEDDDTRDSCQLSSAKILTVIMRHMQITLSEA